MEIIVESKFRLIVQWLKDDEQLFEDRRTKFVNGGNGIFALQILNASLKDQGMYKCLIKSKGEVILTSQGKLIIAI